MVIKSDKSACHVPSDVQLVQAMAFVWHAKKIGRKIRKTIAFPTEAIIVTNVSIAAVQVPVCRRHAKNIRRCTRRVDNSKRKTVYIFVPATHTRTGHIRWVSVLGVGRTSFFLSFSFISVSCFRHRCCVESTVVVAKGYVELWMCTAGAVLLLPREMISSYKCMRKRFVQFSSHNML